MNRKKRTSQKFLFNAKNNRKLDEYFSRVTNEQENNSSIPQMKMDVRIGSRKCPKDTASTPAGRSQLPQENPKDQTTPPTKTIYITLDVNHRDNENRKYELSHSEGDSLYVALNTLNAFKKERETQQGKHVLVRGAEGIQGYINLGMPLSCIPDMSHLVITFVPSKYSNQILRQHDNTVSTDCVKFFIYAIGKGKKKILKQKRLHKKGFRLCVYAFKGETIKDALCKDGRFLSFLKHDVWKLIENLDTILESTQPVDDIEGKVFEVEVEKRTRLSAATSQISESEQRQAVVLRTHIVDRYPCLERQTEEIRKDFQEEMKERKVKSLFNLHKKSFGKLVSNSTTMKEHKDFSRFGQSVGFIFGDNNGHKVFGTCFVFTQMYILTCRHVIDLIVGEGIEPSKWAEIISQCAKVTFSYEGSTEQEKNCFFLDAWFEVSDSTLDYAVLRLKENGQQVPLGLYNGISPVPLNGLLHIIGHPEGKVKSTDNCVVIPLGQREEKFQEHLQARQAEGYNMDYVRMHTEKSFKKIVNDPDVITYNTTFYFGSSGSPVFDSKFSLVAMHTAGFAYEYPSGISSLIEFGTPMEAILSDIKQNHGMWYQTVFIDREDVEMMSDED